MSTHIIAAAWFMSLGAAVAAQTPSQSPPSGPLPESSHSTIGYANVREALEGLRKKPGTQFREQEGWTIVEDRNIEKKTSTLWSFTPEGHPAHPAVAKRTVYERDGKVWIDLNVHCEAKKEACDQLVREFQALNDRIKEQLSGRK